jgi:FtsH-binding integral membrane protein
MGINPYETPQETEDGAVAPDEASRRRLLGVYEIVVLGLLGVLLAAALLHRLQLGNREAYVTSPLIAVEVLGVLVAFVVAFITFLRAVHFLFKRRFANAALSLFLAVLAVVVSLAAMMIDYPTLVYAT